MQRWEYAVVNHSLAGRWTKKGQVDAIRHFHHVLDSAGQKGWELIGYQSVPVTTGVFSRSISSYAYLLLFKRPLE